MSKLEISPEILGALGKLSSLVESDNPVQGTLQSVVELSVATIHGCDAAGVTLVQPHAHAVAGQEVDAEAVAAAGAPAHEAERHVGVVDAEARPARARDRIRVVGGVLAQATDDGRLGLGGRSARRAARRKDGERERLRAGAPYWRSSRIRALLPTRPRR